MDSAPANLLLDLMNILYDISRRSRFVMYLFRYINPDWPVACLLDPVFGRAEHAGYQPRDDAQQQYEQCDQQGARPGQRLPVRVRTGGKLKDHDRQGRHRLVEGRVPELIVELREQ